MAQPYRTCPTKPRTARLVGGLCLALTTACSGSQAASSASPNTPLWADAEPRPVHKRGEGKLIAEVGPQGGILELEDGSRVEIPAGALEQTVSVTFAEGPHTTAFDNREYERTLGRTLDLGPALAPGTPIKVSIPVGELPDGFEPKDVTLATEILANQQRGVQGNGVQTRWDYSSAKHTGNRAEAELKYVPGMRLQFLLSREETEAWDETK